MICGLNMNFWHLHKKYGKEWEWIEDTARNRDEKIIRFGILETLCYFWYHSFPFIQSLFSNNTLKKKKKFSCFLLVQVAIVMSHMPHSDACQTTFFLLFSYPLIHYQHLLAISFNIRLQDSIIVDVRIAIAWLSESFKTKRFQLACK